MATIVPPAELQKSRVRVWDLPLRLFHWALVVAVAVAFLSSEEASPLNQWHMMAGWVVAVLLVFRVVWGFIGGQHSRFVNFVRPSSIGHHLSGLLAGKREASLGHNPAGAVSIVILLSLTAITVGTGAFGGEAAEDLHEATAWALLAMVGLHVAAVIVMSLLERENLVLAMFTGMKPAQHHPGAVDARRVGIFALAMAAAIVAGTIFLILQYDSHAFTPRSTEASEQRQEGGMQQGRQDED